MMRIVMAGAALLCVGAVPREDPGLPDWMTGCWEQKDGDRWTEECWMAPRGGIMLGASRMGKGDTLIEWEAMQIVRYHRKDDGWISPLAYRAAPGGGPATVFKWTSSEEEGVTFINTAHDYPQRIRYWREGDILMAEISMADGSKPMRWRYTRVQ